MAYQPYRYDQLEFLASIREQAEDEAFFRRSRRRRNALALLSLTMVVLPLAMLVVML
jgi:hypothetical protein